MKSKSARVRGGRKLLKKAPLTLLIVILCCAFYPVSAFPQVQVNICEIEAEGGSVIISGDRSRARDTAIRESLKKVIEKAVKTFLSPEAVTQNYQGINDAVYSRSGDYIQNYKIVEERADEDYYRVRIRASVLAEGIRNDLEALGFPVARRNLPRVMVIMFEGADEARDIDTALKSEELSSSLYVINRDLSEEGFLIVSYPRDDYEEVEWSDDDAVSLGRNFNADIVVVGTVSINEKHEIEGTEMNTYRARVSAKAITTDNATVVASIATSAESHTTDSITGRLDAIERATGDAADYLKVRIIGDWQREVSSITLVSITIRGIMSYADYVLLREILKNETRGIKKVFQKRMESGIAFLDVELEGNARFLANELSAAKFDAFSLGIVCTGEDSLEVTIVK